jgi:hypothetical protein
VAEQIGQHGLDGRTPITIIFPAVGALAVRTFTLSALALVASLPVFLDEGSGLGPVVAGFVYGTLAVLSYALPAFPALNA